ncbi:MULTISPECIES: hypothetical protein [Mycolicibacterium]|uniref:Uncharacterized protein n=1 Tax=Mycolicibacterium holsaticum TaxID=152142 RepID=A0A1E3R5H2_9MYCO|nr:hypothetical protein [Mycolicibacterium elephantis]OBA85461.1 hypothetical protein A5633_01155 [Mycolicibacterium elephantis]ODQ85069.1 hypothetical protein BHQ17_24710 [Mycolicibacterium holsaticum]
MGEARSASYFGVTDIDHHQPGEAIRTGRGQPPRQLTTAPVSGQHGTFHADRIEYPYHCVNGHPIVNVDDNSA